MGLMRKTAVWWAALVVAPDLLARAIDLTHARAAALAAYVVGAAASIGIGVVAVCALSAIHRRSRVAAGACAGVFAVWLGVSIPLCVAYRATFHHELPQSYLSFALRDPRYAWTLFTDATLRWERVAFAVVAALFVFAWFRLALWKRAGSIRLRELALAAGLVALGLEWARVAPTDSMPASLHAHRVLVHGLAQLGTREYRLPVPQRIVLPRAIPARHPDVILIVNESLSAYEWAPWSAGPAQQEASAALVRFFDRHAASSAVFLDAKASAGTTNISLPTILAGIAPDSPLDAFTRAPLLWHEARALGYATALLSSQDFGWTYMDEFFLQKGEGPDVAKVAPDFGAPIVNDGGIDDAVVIDAASKLVAAQKARDPERPLLLVVQLNTTHFPCWAPGLAASGERIADVATDRFVARRPASLRYEADLIARFMDDLDASGRLADALVVMTADHGEVIVRGPHRPIRLESYFEDVVRVPLAIKLPDALAAAHPEWRAALAENARARVSNLDIYPTILDVLGRLDEPWPQDRPRLAGKSLLRPMPDRYLVMMNSGATRTWSRQGMAFYHRGYKWLLDDRDGAHVFDASAPPDDTRDVTAEVPLPERAYFARAAQSNPQLSRVVRAVVPAWLAVPDGAPRDGALASQESAHE